MKTLFLIAMLALVSAQTARVPTPADAARSPKGYGGEDYARGKMAPERIGAMETMGGPEQGRTAFRVCGAPDGASRDGPYPRRSGRQAVVFIEQAADTRAGIRVDPKIALFAMQHAAGSQEIVDLETVDDYMSRLSDRRLAQEGAK